MIPITIKGKLHIIRQVHKQIEIPGQEQLEATYKKHTIEIYRDHDDHPANETAPKDSRFYIRVYIPEVSSSTAYDGCAPEEVTTLKEAIKEALIGAQLTNTKPKN